MSRNSLNKLWSKEETQKSTFFTFHSKEWMSLNAFLIQRQYFGRHSRLTLFRPGEGGANWPIARFFLYSSETVQPIFRKFSDFSYNYISYFLKLIV